MAGEDTVVEAGVGAGRALDLGGGASGLVVIRRGEDGVDAEAVAID